MRVGARLAVLPMLVLASGSTVCAQFFVPVPSAFVPCAYSLTPASQNVPAAGGSYTTQMTANCPYFAVASDSWITVSGSGQYQTSGPVAYSVAASNSAVPRTGQISIGTSLLNITQAGIGCVLTFASPGGTVPAAGGDGRATFTVNDGCVYTVAVDSPWISFIASSVADTGTVTFTADPNPNPLPRVAKLSAGGQTFTITQFGTQCAPALSATSLRAPAAGASLSVQVVAPTSCMWSVQNSASWITGIQTTNNVIAFTVLPNTGATARSTFVLVGGIQLTVTQPPPGTYIDTVINAASLPPLTQPVPLAPGELFVIKGSGLGPLTLVGPVLDVSGTFLINSLGGTRVLVNGSPAALVYASEAVVAAIMPFTAMPGQVATIGVEINGTVAAQTQVTVAAAAPAIFTADSSGNGPAAALNSDSSFNTPSTGAMRGSYLVLYATGLGPLQNPLADGAIDAGADPAQNPVLASIGGLNAPVTYAGAAPYIVAGVYQVNVAIPVTVTPGPFVPVTITVAGQTSPAVTVGIQ